MRMLTSLSRVQSLVIVEPRYSNSSTTSTGCSPGFRETGCGGGQGEGEGNTDFGLLGADREPNTGADRIQRLQDLLQGAHGVTDQHHIIGILKVLDQHAASHLPAAPTPAHRPSYITS